MLRAHLSSKTFEMAKLNPKVKKEKSANLSKKKKPPKFRKEDHTSQLRHSASIAQLNKAIPSYIRLILKTQPFSKYFKVQLILNSMKFHQGIKQIKMSLRMSGRNQNRD